MTSNPKEELEINNENTDSKELLDKAGASFDKEAKKSLGEAIEEVTKEIEEEKKQKEVKDAQKEADDVVCEKETKKSLGDAIKEVSEEIAKEKENAKENTDEASLEISDESQDEAQEDELDAKIKIYIWAMGATVLLVLIISFIFFLSCAPNTDAVIRSEDITTTKKTIYHSRRDFSDENDDWENLGKPKKVQIDSFDKRLNAFMAKYLDNSEVSYSTRYKK